MLAVHDPDPAELPETGPQEDDVSDAYRAYYPLLSYLAARRFGVPDDDIDPLVQDVFVSLIRNRERVSDTRAWLVGAACNASRLYWRRRGREARALEKVEWSDLYASEDVTRRLDLARAMSRLPPRCRELLRLRFAEEYSSAALAAHLATTVAYARKLVYQCMTRARHLMEKR